MMRRGGLVVLAVLAVSVTGLPASAETTRVAAHMAIGDTEGQRVDLTVVKRGRVAIRFVVGTRQVGAPGSRLRVSVDGRPPIISTILTGDQCRFDANGSRCTVAYARASAVFRNALHQLRRGRAVHVDVENAGNMAMSRSVDVRRFARSLGPR